MLKELVSEVVEASLDALGQTVPAFGVEPAKQTAHGDYACNVAMSLARAEGKSPRAIAERITQNLVDARGVVAKVEVAGPGFLNFTLIERVSDGILTLPEERELMKKMSSLPEVVQRAAESLAPHLVLYFCQELISEFHAYFTKYSKSERVISDKVEKTQARLALVAAVRQTLRSAEISGRQRARSHGIARRP